MDNSRKGTLYVVATPIGNREDITLRALRVLAEVEMIAAEDTRVTRRLLSRHTLKGTLVSYHEHNEAERTPGLIAKLTAGSSVALVSNAGTPAVSDPGYRLVAAAVQHGIPVVPVPGASAAIAALSASGLPTDSFVFVGFLAKKKNKRAEQIQSAAGEGRTIIFYESPKRIRGLLQELMPVFGDRQGVLSREITKPHEEFVRGSLSDILEELNRRSGVKGECTLLVSGKTTSRPLSMEVIRDEIRALAETKQYSLSEIVKRVAEAFDIPRRSVYREAIQLLKKEK